MKLEPSRFIVVKEDEVIKDRQTYGVFELNKKTKFNTNSHYAKILVAELGRGLPNELSKVKKKDMWDLFIYINDFPAWDWLEKGDILVCNNLRMKKSIWKNKYKNEFVTVVLMVDQNNIEKNPATTKRIRHKNEAKFKKEEANRKKAIKEQKQFEENRKDIESGNKDIPLF